MPEQGGYQKPTMPAAVSGPGKFSQRTDGQPGTTPKQAQRYVGGGEYGTNKDFNAEVVGQAPMAAASSAPMPAPMPASMPSNVAEPIDLFGDTARPDEPITAGMPFGEGPGTEALTYPKKQELETNADMQDMVRIAKMLKPIADSDSSSFATRLLLKKINAMTPPGAL